MIRGRLVGLTAALLSGSWTTAEAPDDDRRTCPDDRGAPAGPHSSLSDGDPGAGTPTIALMSL
jgi:hypothetical protein